MQITKLKRAVIKEELVALCGDFKEALILNQLIYWSERVKDADKFLREEKERALLDNREINILESKGWIYKKSEELNDELMLGLSATTIGRCIKKLVAKGYIHERQNPIYKWDKVKQYRVDLIAIQMDLNKLGYTLEGYTLIAPIKETKKIDNKKVASTRNTNNSELNPTTAELNKNTKSNNILTKEQHHSQHKKNEQNENLSILKDGGIRYIKKSDHTEIKAMDKNVLLIAMQLTLNNATTPSYNYFKKAYADNINKTPKVTKANKNKFNNFDQTYTDYKEKEFTEIVDKSQKAKFNAEEKVKAFTVGTKAYAKALEMGICNVEGYKIDN